MHARSLILCWPAAA